MVESAKRKAAQQDTTLLDGPINLCDIIISDLPTERQVEILEMVRIR